MEVYIITRQTFVNGQSIREDNPVVVTFLSHDKASLWLQGLTKKVHAYNFTWHHPKSCDILEALTFSGPVNDVTYTIIKDEVL